MKATWGCGMGLASGYARAVWEDQGAQASWLPDVHLEVGQVIQRDRQTGAIHVMDTLEALTESPLPAVITRGGPQRVDINRGASFSTSASANAPVGEAKISFSSESSFVFSAADGTITEYATQRILRGLLRDLHSKGRWNTAWQLVTSVRSFKKHTLIVARDGNVTATVSFDVPTQAPNFAAVNFGADVSISSGAASKWQLKNGTPLYEALIVKVGLFGGVDVNSQMLDHERPLTEREQVRMPDVSVVVPDPPELELPARVLGDVSRNGLAGTLPPETTRAS